MMRESSAKQVSGAAGGAHHMSTLYMEACKKNRQVAVKDRKSLTQFRTEEGLKVTIDDWRHLLQSGRGTEFLSTESV